jgi:hypothetical protein
VTLVDATPHAGVAAIQARIRDLATTRYARYEDQFGREGLAWLALAPVWTNLLAEATGFPTNGMSVPEFIEKLRSEGLCDCQHVLRPDGSPERRFWMPRVQRQEVLGHFQGQSLTTLLHSTAIDIARRVTREAPEELVPPLLRRWAELARNCAGGLDAGAHWLRGTVQRLVDPRDIGRSDTGEAQAWIGAARYLAAALGGELESAILIGDHRIELAYRRLQDQRHLEFFLSRTAQKEALERLLDRETSSQTWALHYLGMGGVGKTMLVRHIVAQLAPDAGYATSRVDFDHLNPDYPVRKPAWLLVELAEELRAYSQDPNVDRVFEQFGDRVLALHEALSGGQGSEHALGSIRHEKFDDLMRVFTQLLRQLGRPVLFILDTCEELAKLQPVGGRIPSLEATFEILKRIHRAVPSTRVVFAGRRFLARGGYQWRVNPRSVGEMRHTLPGTQRYLRLHPIRGFDRDEAERYLKLTPRLLRDDELREAVLRRSPESATPPEVGAFAGSVLSRIRRRVMLPRALRRLRVRRGASANPPERYNPFDLALYAGWVREDPDLTGDIIDSGTIDPYVQLRVLRPIEQQPAIRPLIPAAVLLGRFNERMLYPVLPEGATDFPDAFRELGGLEWMDHQPDRRGAFLEVDRNLLPRLRRYYENHERRHLLLDAAAKLGPGLAEQVRESTLDSLSVDAIAAPLRLLPPGEGLELWDDLTLRIAAEAAWDWARNVTARILADEFMDGYSDGPLRGAVAATYTAATLHLQPGVSVHAEWWKVQTPRHPFLPPALTAWYDARRRLGLCRAPDLRTALERLAGVATDGLHADPGNVAGLGQGHLEQLAASTIAAVEAVLDLLEKEGEVLPRAPRAWILTLLHAALAWSGSEEIRGYARLLRMRTSLQAGEPLPDAVIDDLVTLAGGMHERETRQCWLDWRAPTTLADRMRLELLRQPGITARTEPEAESWAQRALPRLEQIDAERLVACRLRGRLDQGLLPWALLQETQGRESYRLERQPHAPAHAAVPPLFAVLAEGWAALGEVDRALELLDQYCDAAEATRADEPTLAAGRRARTAISRYLRLPGAPRPSTQADRPEHDEYGEWEILTTGRSQAAAVAPRYEGDLLHLWWRGLRLANREAADLAVSQFLDRLDGLLPDIGPGEVAALRELRGDLDEVKLVCRRFRLTRPDLLEELSRRLDSLTDFAVSTPPPDPVPCRAEAVRCLREGEIAALRVGAGALDHLREAERLFELARDPVGRFIAAVTAALTLVHDARLKEAHAYLEENVCRAYRALPRRQQETMPHWQDLWPPGRGHLKLSSFPFNSGWYPRLLACIHATRGSAVADRIFRDFLQGAYGASVPVELAPERRVRPSLPILDDPRISAFLRTTALVAVAVVLGFLVLGVVEATPAALRHGGAVQLLGTLLVALTLLAWGVAAASPDLLRWLQPLRGWLTSRGSFFVAITEPAVSGGARSTLSSVLEFGGSPLRVPELLGFRAELALTEVRLSWPREGAPAVDGKNAQRLADLRLRLQGLRQRLGGHFVPVRLDVDRNLQAYDWERVLLQLARDEEIPPHLRFWRTSNVASSLRTYPALRITGSVQVFSAGTWRLMLEEGWAPLALPTFPDDAYADHRPRSSVRHLVGVPVRTASGVKLRIQAGRSGYERSAHLIRAPGESHEQLIRPERLHVIGVPLVVVQGEPVPALQWLDTDRETTSDLRAFAADLFANGASTVLVLPSLPPALATHVLSTLAAGLSGETPLTRGRMLHIVARMQAALERAPAPDDAADTVMPAADRRETVTRETILELAGAITLFCR